MSNASPDVLPVIFGLSGTTLTDDERAFFAQSPPWGFILFARNIESRKQLCALTGDLRELAGNPALPILIDQEGGSVARLRPPLSEATPPAEIYGQLAERNMRHATEAAFLGGGLIAADLHSLGITVNCAPCLDFRTNDTADMMTSRCFGDDVETIATLAEAFIDGMLTGGVLPVIKHLPGLGRACVDSHVELPRVETPRAELEVADFEICRRFNHAPMGMTAHALYTDIDATHPATLSPHVINNVIRVGFDGLLMTDDLSMDALSGTLDTRAAAALEAGCDIALHCNGDLAEMTAIASALPPMTPDAKRRTARVDARIGTLICTIDRPAAHRKWTQRVGKFFPKRENAL